MVGQQQHKGQSKDDTAAHAAQVRAVLKGQDSVDWQPTAPVASAAGLNRDQVVAVRSNHSQRPLEPSGAGALVAFPRKWSQKRGRYCKFRAPGAGSYGIVRARPTIF